MDIEDLYFKKYIGEFYSQNNMDELYKYVQTCTEELTISSSDLTDFIMQTIKGGTPDMKIKYGDNSINSSYIFNEVSEKILENIPETIKKLSVPYLLFKNNYKTLEKFKNLEELEINDSFPLTEDEIIFLSENTNIKTIIIGGTKKSTIRHDYFCKGYYSFSTSHFANGRLSDSGMNFSYPTLCKNNYK